MGTRGSFPRGKVSGV